MTNILQNIAGLGALTDQVIATDCLNSAKSAVRNLSIAITEVATPELRDALREQLKDAVEAHEGITNYMISKGYYHPFDVGEQIQVELNLAKSTLNLTQQ